MERDTAKNLGDYKTVHTFTDCQMHSFVERLKTRVAEGKFVLNKVIALSWKVTLLENSCLFTTSR
jgi:hypothetical protein